VSPIWESHFKFASAGRFDPDDCTAGFAIFPTDVHQSPPVSQYCALFAALLDVQRALTATKRIKQRFKTGTFQIICKDFMAHPNSLKDGSSRAEVRMNRQIQTET
jgi:hypothetical protein